MANFEFSDSHIPKSDNSFTSCEQKFIDFLKSIPQIDSARIQEIYRKLTSYEQLIREARIKFNLISQHDIEILWIRHFQDSLIPFQIFHNLLTAKESTDLTVDSVPSLNKFIEGTSPSLNSLEEGAGAVLAAASGDPKDRPLTEMFHVIQKPKRIIDVGSGAGLPGVPLSIVLPGSEITFLESNGKKCNFLEECIVSLSLKNACVIRERAEILACDPLHREKYDFAAARAVAKPASAFELLLPFVKVGGKAIFWASGEEWDDKVKIENVGKILGGRFVSEKEYILPEGDNIRKRKIILIKKVESTDRKYPRGPGIPQKRPLI